MLLKKKKSFRSLHKLRIIYGVINRSFWKCSLLFFLLMLLVYSDFLCNFSPSFHYASIFHSCCLGRHVQKIWILRTQQKQTHAHLQNFEQFKIQALLFWLICVSLPHYHSLLTISLPIYTFLVTTEKSNGIEECAFCFKTSLTFYVSDI